MEPEKWAERNDALISRDVALGDGLSRGQIRRRVDAGRYVAVRRGVYAINGAPPSWRQVVRAVVLAHPGVFASHETSQRLLGGIPSELSELIHVCGTLADRCRLPGVIGHRTTLLEPGDVTSRWGIPCTSPLRTVIDLSGVLSEKELGDVVDDFVRRRILRLWEPRARVARLKPAPGRSLKKLHAVLGARIPGYDPGESPLEARIMLVLASNGIPLPTQQHRVRLGTAKYRLDFAWPDKKVYLEGNGFGWHSLTSDLDNDARRQNRLVADGWRPIEITWRMPDQEIADSVRNVLGS